MAEIKIEAGVTLIGNQSSEDISLDGIDENINSLKTLMNGKWKSWSAGAPDDFQGFTEMLSGQGYVCNSEDKVVIPTVSTMVDINNMNIEPGLNMLCLPSDTDISGAYLPRMKLGSIKTMFDSWKSWTADAPDDFQGFTNIESGKGYVCNVEEVFDNYLDSSNRNVLTGVTVGTEALNNIEESIVTENDDIVVFDKGKKYLGLIYDVIPIDDSKDLLTTNIDVNGENLTLQYPEELDGETFSLVPAMPIIDASVTETSDLGEIVDTDIVETSDLGEIVDTDIVETSDLGNIPVNDINVTEEIDMGSIADSDVTEDIDSGLITDEDEEETINAGKIYTFLLPEKVYTYVFTENENNDEPILPSISIDVNELQITYKVLETAEDSNINTMLLEYNGIKTAIEFKDEYLDNEFIVLDGNVAYGGVFTASENEYINLEEK